MPSPFVLLLQREQHKARLSSDRFARDVLGVSPAAWRHVQTGLRGPGARIISGALRAFPDLHADIAACLAAPPMRVIRPPSLRLPTGYSALKQIAAPDVGPAEAFG